MIKHSLIAIFFFSKVLTRAETSIDRIKGTRTDSWSNFAVTDDEKAQKLL